MGVTKAKEELQTFRFRMVMKPQILPTDVIPIVNNAWACSFARTSRRRQALAERGWNPCNRSLLFHKDVLATKTKMDAEQPSAQQPLRSNDLMAELTLASAKVVATTDLNLDEGYVADVVDVLNSGWDNDLARHRSLERKRESDKSLLDLDKAKKLTAGKLVKFRQHRLDKTVTQHQLEYVRHQENEQERLARKRRAEEDKLIAKAANCRSLPECNWQVKHYKAMCSYKKHKKDTALGKNLDELRVQWHQRKVRPSPTFKRKAILPTAIAGRPHMPPEVIPRALLEPFSVDSIVASK
jgi:hypothetical protein